jgi:phage shock protein PspC (stress-responsive transcriptional regulator)
MNDRLYRTVDDRVLAGVCGGLAVRLGLDPSLVRVGYAIVALLTGIFPLLILYVIMAAVVPEEPTGFAGAGRSPTPPGPDAVPGWTPPGDASGWDAGVAAPAAWPPADEIPGDVGGAPDEVTLAGGPVPGSAPPPPPAPAWPAVPPPSPGAGRERRRGDPLPAIIGGLVLVGLGVYFLVRDQLSIDWGVVWPAGLVALGVVVVLAAFRRG